MNVPEVVAVVALVAVLGAAVVPRRWPGLSHGLDALNLVVVCIGTQLLVAEALGLAPELPASAVPVPVAAAVAILLPSHLLMRDPNSGLGRLALGRGPGGRSFRVFAPLAMVMPIAGEFVLDVMTSTEIHGKGALHAIGDDIVTAVLAVFVVWAGSTRLNLSDERLRRTERSTLLNVLVHDLRAPLLGVRSLAQLVHDRWDELPSEQRRGAIGVVASQSRRVLGLVEDATLPARIAAGATTLEPRLVEVDEAIDDAATALGIRARRSSTRQRAWADPDHLRLMLQAAFAIVRRGPDSESVHVMGRSARASLELVVTRDETSECGSAPVVDGNLPGVVAIHELATLVGGAATTTVDDEGVPCVTLSLPTSPVVASRRELRTRRRDVRRAW